MLKKTTTLHKLPSEEEFSSLRILLVDDDTFILTMISAWLEEAGYEVKTSETGTHAVYELPHFKPHLVITDLRMEDMDGITLLKEIQKYNPVLPVIMLSGKAQISDAIRAAHQGIFEFFTKPIEPAKLFDCIQAAINQVGNYREEIEFAPEIIHRSSIMANLLKQAQRVAKTHSSVFIGGATGTGKELLARAIHRASPRGDKVFLAINCGALSEQLLESELFGHEKGAFTGAVRKNLGLFQAAHNGTLFLDEVGDMPLTLQVKLLRVLQEGKVKPVGSIDNIKVDVRIISATHQDLALTVKRGEFREDLFYRLNVIPLYMPTLAERREDIPLLVNHFLTLQTQREDLTLVRFSPEALEYMMSVSWPGNVRQLQNVVEQCTVLSVSPVIPLSLVKQALQESETSLQTLEEARNEFDYHYLHWVLRLAEGDVSHAARIAGCEVGEFERLLASYEINPIDFRNPQQEENTAPEGSGIHLH
ncbi:MAG: sigma 54-interacting transcriptional regulator [Thioploca sp.]|nr:sigma 54-interacting transcriptional regulator [Thioploca sp.]